MEACSCLLYGKLKNCFELFPPIVIVAVQKHVCTKSIVPDSIIFLGIIFKIWVLASGWYWSVDEMLRLWHRVGVRVESEALKIHNIHNFFIPNEIMSSSSLLCLHIQIKEARGAGGKRTRAFYISFWREEYF